MRLTKNNESFMVILPKQIALAKGWEHGQPLECKITERGDLLIKEK
ncbi:hypothetical protein HYV88_01490 [Candidatus Woesearchaeota archaeon]|nr:hypothetical protein [Candidatus Woesearchaeota archaeon]